MSLLQVAGFLDHSTVNGIGFRSVIFLSGCHHNCDDCHNGEMQDPLYGETLSSDIIYHRILKNKALIDGVTLSGGEPFEQAEALYGLLAALRKQKLSIWCYTGYLYENLLKDPEKAKLLPLIDVLVDGPFIVDYKDESLLYRGSSNQRFLKLHQGKVEEVLHFDLPFPLK